MSKTRLQQTSVIGVIVLLLAFLYTRDVKGLVKPAENKQSAATAAAQPAVTLTLDDATKVGKNMISNRLASEFTALENEYERANEADKIKIAETLAKKWEDVAQLVPRALYLELIAQKESSLSSWVRSGDALLKAYDMNQDSLTQPAILSKAHASFKAALAIDSTSIPAKTGMGITIVNGMGMPMDGITMLLDVVQKDPKNLNAQMQLGMFSIRSGQFDKAIERYKQVVNIKPVPEAYFYMGTAYESLGKKAQAIEAYLESKKIANNPTITSFVDKKVAELKK